MRNLLFVWAFLVIAACDPAGDERAPAEPPPPFDAGAAWEEFEDTFRLFYAYLERDDFDVDAYLEALERAAKAAEEKEAFRQILNRGSYAFTDPHLIIGPLAPDDFNVIYSGADLRIEKRGDAFVVADVRAGSAADASGIRPGWVLVSANGASISKQIPSVFAGLLENPTGKQSSYAATLIANGKRAGERNLEFENASGQVSVRLPSPREFDIALREQPILETRLVDGIGVIRPNNSLGNNDLIQAFDAAMREMAGTRGVIIDLRNTPSGGNTEVARSMIGHFIREIRPYQIHEIPSLEREFTVPRRFVEQVKPRAPYYDPARVVVLGGYWTGSMGEGLVIGLSGAANVHTIASDMGDLLGGLRNYSLKISGVRMDLGNEALFHVNGLAREDYVADTPLASADRDASGGDPALAAAMAYLNR